MPYFIYLYFQIIDKKRRNSTEKLQYFVESGNDHPHLTAKYINQTIGKFMANTLLMNQGN